MKIDIPNKILYLRSSETSEWINCPRRPALTEPKDLDDTEEDYSGEAARLGNKIHLIIKNILQDIPYMLDEEAMSILGIPAKFEGFVPYKKIISVNEPPSDTCETEQEKLKWIKHTYKATKAYAQEGGSYKAVVPIDVYSTDSCEELSLEAIIHPLMFGKDPLVNIEFPMTWESQYDDWKIVFSGKLDAATHDFSLIADWKTTARTPTPGSHDFDHYRTQQCIYKYLANRAIGIDEFSPGIAILGFIVKNKIPKFVPQAFKITRENLMKTKEFILKCAHTIIRYYTEGELPLQSISASCNYCRNGGKCFSECQLIPSEDISCQRVISRTDEEV